MSNLTTVAVLAALAAAGAARAEDLKLPAQITPALRAACEADVRRMCVGENPNPSFAKVKSCVLANYMQFGQRCQVQIALAGLR